MKEKSQKNFTVPRLFILVFLVSYCSRSYRRVSYFGCEIHKFIVLDVSRIKIAALVQTITKFYVLS